MFQKDFAGNGRLNFFIHTTVRKKEKKSKQKNIRQKSKADFTVGNILSFNQYFGRHGLPSSGSYISYVRP